MNTIEFLESVLFDEGGYEISLFTSSEFDGEYSSQRACMLAVLSKIQPLVDYSDFTDYSIEQALIHSDTYVKFGYE